MNHAHIAVASPLGLSVQASGRTIACFAWQHMKAATTFRDQVASLESANMGGQFGPFVEDIRSYGSGCIMSAAGSLEAYINECFIDPTGPLRQQMPNFELEFWGKDGIERKSPLAKYQIALKLLGQPKLDEQTQPFLDAWALFELRNGLVHFKPTWDPARKRTVDMIQVLSGRYDLSPFLDSGADFVTMKSMSASCARWVVRTALLLMKEFHHRTSRYESKFSNFSCFDV